MERDRHATDDELEDYSRDKLPEAEAEVLEEHLLVCPQCQDRLAAHDAFVKAARRAAAHLQMEPEKPAESRWQEVWRWAFRPARLATAMALAVLVVAAAVGWRQGRPSAPVFSVYLQAVRGENPLSGASAPAGRPLHLRLDAGGLVVYQSYPLEIADAHGAVLAETIARRNSGEITAELDRRLAGGKYWVRLFEPDGQHALLREFGLTVH